MQIEEIVCKMKNNRNFEIKSPCGLPKIMKEHTLPEDVKKFYSICGGVICYVEDGGFPITILDPSDIRLASPVLLGKRYEEDISSSWYLVADAEDENYISIDFSPERLGRCYESFEYSHAICGRCPIVAMSFTELLNNIYEYSGDYFFWKEDVFTFYGDAYQGK